MQRTAKLALIAASVALRLASGPSASNCPPAQELETTLGRASASLQQGRYQAAVEALEPFSRTRCDARIYLLLAAALEAAGDSAKAEDTLGLAHSLWPSNNSVSASLARKYFSAGHVNEAAQALGDFHVTANTPLQEMQLAVVVYLAAHRLIPAVAVAETACKSYPSLNTLLLLANALQLQGRYKDVNRILQQQRNVYSNSPAFLITLAESENDAMLWKAAHDDLEHALALDNKSYQAHYLLGNVLEALNETDTAESEYRTAITLAPNQPRTYYRLALLLHARQDDPGEESFLTQALAVDDRYAPAYCELGRLLLNRQRFEEAVSQLNRAIQYNPQIEQAYYLLARAYAGLGKKDNADATVKRYAEVRAANRRSSVDKRPGQLGAEEGRPSQ